MFYDLVHFLRFGGKLELFDFTFEPMSGIHSKAATTYAVEFVQFPFPCLDLKQLSVDCHLDRLSVLANYADGVPLIVI